MIQSMTGYGKAQAQTDLMKMTVEVRSLNSKTMDVSMRLPQIFRSVELELRKLINQSLGRGKIDFSVQVEKLSAQGDAILNRTLIETYFREISEISQALGTETDIFSHVMRLPDVINTERSELAKAEWEVLQLATTQALNRLNEFRAREGEAMRDDMTQSIRKIDSLLTAVEPFDQERKDAVRVKMERALEEFGEGVDRNRFEQELIYYFEKLDVNEEKVRLRQHCNYFLETMETDRPGKKLGFIGQEIGREINTLGSKSNHAEMQRIVVQMKDELEKIKELTLNVL